MLYAGNDNDEIPLFKWCNSVSQELRENGNYENYSLMEIPL